MPTIKVGNINMYYEDVGEGEVLVLIAGYANSSALWFQNIPTLSKNYRVIAPDNRGTGRSDKPDSPYTMEMMTADIAGLLDAIGVNTVHLFGASMGGFIAQHFALKYPERVASLILGCSHCGGSHYIVSQDKELAEYWEHRIQLTPEQAFLESISLMVSQQFIDNNPAMFKEAIAQLTKYPTPVHVFGNQGNAMNLHDTYDRLPQIKVPTLVITGDADRMVHHENSRILASRIPGAELVILKNAGHGFFVEAEKETNSLVLNFLQEHRMQS